MPGPPHGRLPEPLFLRACDPRRQGARSENHRHLLPTVTVGLRMTEGQRGKLQRLGGAKWVRQRIDKAKSPNAKVRRGPTTEGETK